MIKCPFCHFDNEDGALFCERCTSDLAAVAQPQAKPAVPPLPHHHAPPPLVPAIPLAEPMPYEGIPIVSAEPLDVIPLAPLAPATPIDLAPASAIPLELETLHSAPAATMSASVAAKPATVEIGPPGTAAPTMPIPSAPAPSAPSAASAPSASLPAGAQPRLLVQRGQKRNVEYPVYEGLNFIGRADEKPVDIDLEEQEPPDRIWCSRQHACISFEGDQLLIEDLNSANGTYVNRTRVYPGQKRPLLVNDIIQIGNVQLKVLA